jgi:hypothetical protein
VRRAGIGQELDARHEVREPADLVEHAESTLALADEVMGPIRRRDVTDDARDGADAVQFVESGVLGLRVLLQQEPDLGIGPHRLLGAGHGLLALDGHRQHHAGKQHHVAHREDDQHVLRQARCRPLLVGRLGRLGLVRAHPFTSTRSAPGQQQLQAPIVEFLPNQFPGAGRQGQPALESTVRNLEALDGGATASHGQSSVSANDQLTGRADQFHPFRRDAGEGNLDEQFIAARIHVDRRFPARLLRASGQAKELPLQALGLVQEVHGLRPHPDGGIASLHRPVHSVSMNPRWGRFSHETMPHGVSERYSRPQ